MLQPVPIISTIIVSTPSYAGTVVNTDGDERPMTWTNTNLNLHREEVVGIKTGTTSSAGACLFTAYEHDGHPYYIVVLGSQSSRLRYHDTEYIIQNFIRKR